MENKVEIRKAEPEDMDIVYRFICELENLIHDYPSFCSIYLNNLKNPDCYYLIASYDKEPVAFISFHIQNLLHHCGRVGEIQELFVDKTYRKLGIARMLIKEIDGISERGDLKSVEVASNKKRTDNVAIYENLGFTLSHNKLTKEVLYDRQISRSEPVKSVSSDIETDC